MTLEVPLFEVLVILSCDKSSGNCEPVMTNVNLCKTKLIRIDSSSFMYYVLLFVCVLFVPFMSEDAGRASETLRENIGTILSRYSDEGKRAVRNIERTSKKVIDAKYAAIFNDTCIYIYFLSNTIA